MNVSQGTQWRRTIAPLVGVAIFGAATPVAAQQASAASARSLAITATVDTLYDSNVVRGVQLNPLNRQAHTDDYRVSPSLYAVYNRSTGRIALAANGLVGYDFFNYNKYLNSHRYSGGGSLTYHSGSRCQVAVTGNVSSRQDGIRDFGAPLVDPSGTRTDTAGTVIDNVETSTSYGSNFGCGTPTGRLTFGGGYTHNSASNASVRRKFGDSENDTYTGNVGIGILQPGQVSLNGSYSTIAYPNRATGSVINGIPPQLINSGVATYRVGITLSRPIGNRLSGRIGASFLHADPSGGQAAYSSPAYTLGLTYTPSARLSATLSGSRDISPSANVGALYSVTDQLLADVRYTLGRSITLSANAGLVKENYKQGFAIPGEPARGTDTTTSYGAGIAFHPRSLFDINLNISQSIRRSTPPIFNFRSTRVGLTLAVHI
jgi:hypothetical protein